MSEAVFDTAKDVSAPLREPVLRVAEVTKDFGATRAVDNVTFDLMAGEKLALVGENGAGKSTLAGIASGLTAPSLGTVSIGGERLARHNPIAARDLGVRLAPQEVLLCPELTIAENVSLGNVPSRGWGIVDKRAMREVAEKRLSSLGIVGLDLDRAAYDLSVVEKAVIQIARALTEGAKVLIVDEPTAPMSGAEVDTLLELLERTASRGIGILYVSHRLEEILRLADRALVIRDGRLVDEFFAPDITKPKLIRSMVGGREFGDPTKRTGSVGGTALAVRNLTHRTIRDLSFEVSFGEILGFYGVAGSGRDELSAPLAGAERPDEGSLLVEGRPAGELTTRKAIEKGIGYVPPERSAALVPERSVRENISLAVLARLSRHGIKKFAQERAIVEHWVQVLSIKAPSIDAPITTLSGGGQQKVLLARCLAAGSRILILEEPTRGVDVATKAEIYDLLRRLADDGVAIVVASSDVDDITSTADRVLVLQSGSIAAELSNPSRDQVLAAATETE